MEPKSVLKQPFGGDFHTLDRESMNLSLGIFENKFILQEQENKKI